MIVLQIFALAALAHARPEPPSGYNYQRPQPLPLPIPQYQPSFNIDSSQSHQSNVAFRPELQISNSGSSSGFQGSSGGYQQGISSGFQQGSSSVFQGSSSGFHGSSFVQPNLAPIIQKHIYVHVPPPEPVEEQQRFVSQALAPRKNYKIIFIKAPSAPAISQQILQQQQEVQEKTIVYVLVKKPDEQEALTLAGFAPTKPSKPEVYFIKYKTQKDAGIGGGHISGSGSGGFSTGLDLSSGGGLGSSSISSGSISGISSISSSGSSQSHGGSVSTQYGPPGASGPY